MEREFCIKIGKKTVYTCTWRSLLYMLCFFALCVIDQRIKTCSGLDGLIETFRNLTGVVIALLILSHYRWSEFKAYRTPYLILSGLCAVGGTAAIVYGSQRAVFLNAFLTAVLDVILFCFILMHTFIAVIIEKRRPALKKSFLAVWAVMMALMMISRSNYLWPFCFFVMFGCFYLTDFTKDERGDMLQGLLNGVILGFFVLQGLCFVFRPFDRVRYQGIYHNSNLNALFYLAVLAAVLGKILYVYKKDTGRAIKIFYWLGAGVVLSFLFLSIGRAAWVAAFFMVLIFLWSMNKLLLNKRFWKNAGILILSFLLMFPVCFSAARYLPAVFHHPIWFWGEYEPERVHSYDPWNVWKYVELDEFLDAAMGRITDSFKNLWEHTNMGRQSQGTSVELPEGEENAAGELIAAGETDRDGEGGSAPAGEADREDAPVSVGETDREDEFLPEGADEPAQTPVLSDEQGTDSFLVRKTIYTYYAKRLNFRGHPESEQGFQLTENYHIGHAHNIFLQYGTDFGIQVMVLFAVLIVWGALRLRRAFLRTRDMEKPVYLLYLLIPVLFGMFEYAWGTGSLSIALLFLSLGAAARETTTPQ